MAVSGFNFSNMENTPGKLDHFDFFKCRKNLYASTMLLLMLAGALPIWLVTFVPCTDFPQHLCQTRNFYQTFYSGSDTFEISYFGANTLIYYLLFAFWHFFTPIIAGKIVLTGVLWAGIGAIFLIAWRRQRPIEHAIIASCLLFNSSFYWGFLPFMLGWPVFALWFLITTEYEQSKHWFVKAAGLAILLFFAHTLWLVAGFGWLIIFAFSESQKKGMSTFFKLLTPVLPVCIYSAIWFLNFYTVKHSDGFSVAPQYLFSALEKFHPLYLSQMSNVGIKGALSYLTFFVLSALMAGRILFPAATAGNQPDRPLRNAALLGFAFAFSAPDVFLNTILFSQRWLPYAIILLLLSLPGFHRNEKSKLSFALAFFTVLIAWQGVVWKNFERTELSGLQESLDRISRNSRLAWIDYRIDSDMIAFRPFAQLGSYAEFTKDCTTNYSFAEHNNGIVRFKNHASAGAAQILYSGHHEIPPTEVGNFDYILVNGSEADHRSFTSRFAVTPMASTGFWRLYHPAGKKP